MSAKALVEQRDTVQSQLKAKEQELQSVCIRLAEAESWADGARKVEQQNQSNMQHRLYMAQVPTAGGPKARPKLEQEQGRVSGSQV